MWGRKATSEIEISVNELYALITALNDATDASHYDVERVQNAELSQRLMHLWSYWSKRTSDPESFMLRIKR